MAQKTLVKTTLLLLITLLSIALSMTFGSASLDISDVVYCLVGECASQMQQIVVWQVRVPRILVGFVAGGGLAMAGAILQNSTRNPLADPYLFGIVSGAALGVTIATHVFTNNVTVSLPISAFLGALFSIVIVVGISKVLRQMEQLLLAGVAVSFMLSALAQLILFLGEPFATNRVMFWLMGSLARVELEHFYIIASVILFGAFIVLALSRQIDALLLSDESAKTLGVDVDKLRLLMMAICAALTATIVAYCGGIGFVGLMIPHIVRHWFGVTTVPLIIGSFFIGGCFLVWVDVMARSLFTNQEIPIGIITSALGSLFFLFVIYQSRRIEL